MKTDFMQTVNLLTIESQTFLRENVPSAEERGETDVLAG